MNVSFNRLADFDNHEMIVSFYDADTSLKGFIAIHSTKLGLAVGGTRFHSYDSHAEAAEDALRLSKAMSYKCALAGLRYGGGKAVIIGGPKIKTKELLKAYARVIENLGGLLKTGTDVGITDADVLVMANHTRHMIGAQTLSDPELPSTSGMAALGVFYAIEASLKHRYGSPSVVGRRIGIKGLGKLGGRLGELLHEAGASLIVSDIDPAKVEDFCKKVPTAKVVPVGEIHTEEMDVYAPCALGHEFTTKSISELKTSVVAGGANNQLVNVDMGEALHRRGILYAPDYIANAGGLIHVTAELDEGGYDRALVHDRVRSIGDTLLEIYRLSDRQKQATHVVADELALKIINGG